MALIGMSGRPQCARSTNLRASAERVEGDRPGRTPGTRAARDQVFATLSAVLPEVRVLQHRRHGSLAVTNMPQYDDGMDSWPPGCPMANAAADCAAWMASARGAPATRFAA